MNAKYDQLEYNLGVHKWQIPNSSHTNNPDHSGRDSHQAIGLRDAHIDSD